MFALCGPVQAEERYELLPVALGHKSIAFKIDRQKQARLPAGARVEFTAEDENGIPRKIKRLEGFVLGTRNNVIFIELDDRAAVKLAAHRANGQVKYFKVDDPVAEKISDRRAYQESGTEFAVAPRMRRLTVKLSVDLETTRKWRLGDELTFFGVYDRPEHRRSFGRWVTGTNASVIFQFVQTLRDGTHELTVIADPSDARAVLSASLKGQLTITPSKEKGVDRSEERRCFVTRRVGVERIREEIPCTN
ncbi:MAG: hypothetical protein AAFY06_11665 [Pseudomonadota bacterium]